MFYNSLIPENTSIWGLSIYEIWGVRHSLGIVGFFVVVPLHESFVFLLSLACLLFSFFSPVLLFFFSIFSFFLIDCPLT